MTWEEGREKEGGRREREQAGSECHGELNSLVSCCPLHGLPRDQQGAKSTQGNKKWRVFREGEKERFRVMDR